MYKVFDGKTWLTFNSYTMLVNYLSKFNSRGYFGNHNNFFKKVAGNDKDTRVDWDDFRVSTNPLQYIKREYKIVNECGANIYSGKLIRDVLNWTYSEEIEQQRIRELGEIKKYTYYGRWGYLPDSAYPEFRRGPWPYIHSFYRYNSVRHIRTYQEKKQAMDEDAIGFVRGSRGTNLPSSWDSFRDWRNDGWKHQCKFRHQWERKAKYRADHIFGKGVYVAKYGIDRNYADELDNSNLDEDID